MSEEVKSAIKSLKTRKSCIELRKKMIQAAGDNLVKMTHDLCSKMYEDKKCSQRLGKGDYCATTQKMTNRNTG